MSGETGHSTVHSSGAIHNNKHSECFAELRPTAVPGLAPTALFEIYFKVKSISGSFEAFRLLYQTTSRYLVIPVIPIDSILP